MTASTSPGTTSRLGVAMRRASVPLLALMGVACLEVDGSTLAQISVARAEIHDMQVVTAAMIGGVVDAEGSLLIEDRDGVEHNVELTLRGGTVGFVFEAQRASAMEPTRLDLPHADLSGDQLLGRYLGNSESMVAGVGVEVRHLSNEHEVVLEQPYFVIGVGMMIGFEWIDVALADIEVLLDEEEGP